MPPREVKHAPLAAQDLTVLQFLAEHRAVATDQVAALLSTSAAAADRRLRSLQRAGLARRERVFANLPAACWITRRGLGLLESRLPAPRLDLKGYRHDVGCAWLWLAARDGAFGALSAQISEREMRSRDRREDGGVRRLGVGFASSGPGGPHYPDLLLETAAGKRVAVELELSAKSARRLDRIMLAYAIDARIDVISYFVSGHLLASRVRDSARRAGLQDRVAVRLLASGSPAGAPCVDPGRTAVCSRGRDRTVAAAR